MGLPQIMINFSSYGASAIRRSSRGSVALVVAGEGDVRSFTSIGQAESAGLDSDTLEALRLCFLGYPFKVTLIYAGDDTEAALTLAERHSAGGWICAPGFTAASVVSYVKQRRKLGHTVRAVVVNAMAPDCEGIVNFCGSGIEISLGAEPIAVTAENYACRIAGTLAGLSLSQSATYLALPEVVSFDESPDPDADIDAGKLIICRGVEGAKLGRAVTSLTTIVTGTSSELRKIKISEAVDMMSQDIKATFEKDYIGKIINDYDNKLLLVTAINGYFSALEGNVLDREYDNRAFISYDAQREYLESRGVDVDSMSDTEILSANTASQVFLAANVRLVDAMEDLTFSVTM